MPTLVSHPDEVKVLSRRFGQGAADIDKYLELDGYKAVQKALAEGPEKMAAWIIDTMKASGLRGRGGAGFPTGLKWSFVPKQSEKPKYVLVNGDESEPGTCKDHVLFLHDPHAVIEGTMIAGLAIGSKLGFIYLRGEYRYLLKIVEKAVADAYARGFLGKNIFGTGVDFDIITQTGAGAYEVGEESALMESLEGKRGVPRIKPPFPAVVGLYGGPTVINNAETIASAPHILLMGGEAYAKLGSERNGGTRLFGISGHVERPGIYELPMGYNLKKAIYEVAGGIKDGKKLKAVVPGGSSCPVLLPEEIDVGLDFDQMGKAGTMLGSGGIVVLDETVSIVEFAMRVIAFYQHESCGWCIPCREGTDWIKKTLTRVYEGGGSKKDIDNVQYLAENMMGRTFCPLGDAAAMPTLGFVKKFRKEFEDYIEGHKAGTPLITVQDLVEHIKAMPDVTFTVDGKKLTAPAGTLLIDACKSAGIEIPAFCYYPGLSLQAACRMCVVRIEKMPKLQTACTTPVAEGMVIQTETPEIAQARKATLQLLLGNHPLDCPVCDAGGECELQDMTFKYGAADSFYAEPKNHREEQKWSPVVYFDRPRCILCYRCVRMCGEGMDVFALGIQNRGSSSVIAPNVPAQMSPDDLAHVDCEQCGMCIDACPVGALTSGTYRYKTRPWEMNHVGTICTHCGDGCKTTLGVRSTSDGSEIVRGDNRDKSGINGDFLCNKGRYAFDFANNDHRITHPLVRQPNGELKPVSWEEAFDHVGKRLRELRDTRGGKSIGVIGGNRLTNEEAYLLQKFARTILGTNNIDHHRTADYVSFAQALAGQTNRTASLRDTLTAPAILLVGGDPTNQAPGTAWNIRTNVRNNGARLYVVNSAEIKLRRQAKAFVRLAPFGYGALSSYLAGDNAAASSAVSDVTALSAFRDTVKAEENLLILIGSELRGAELKKLIDFGLTIPGAKFALLSDYANSRGAADMGLLPDMLPGYTPIAGNGTFAEYNAPAEPGLDMLEIFDAAGRGELSALYVVGSNPVARYSVDPAALKNTFVVVQEMFLTETAALADVILPAANLYEKSGSVTNSYGDLQQVKKAGDRAGVRTDFEMIVRIADKMGAEMRKLVPFGKGLRADMGQSRGAQSGEADRHAVWLTANNLEPKLSPFDPYAILDEIQRLVPGYNLLRLQLLSGNDQHLQPAASGLVQIGNRRDLVLPANDTLFTSGTLGRYSAMLNDLQQNEKREGALTQIQAAD